MASDRGIGWRRAARLIGAALLVAAPAGAQRLTRSSKAPRTAAVRAELATVLLQSGRYDEAAREFRVLLRRSPRSAEYRLGLARALAWGNHPREAERELRLYRAEHGSSTAVEGLLRAVRDAYEPRAAEAAGWVAERPDYAPYRLALARALAREGDASLAAAQYDTLMSRAPGDTALRHSLAQLLVASGRTPAALAQYDTLLALAPTAALYRERAEVHLVRHEPALAELDLRSSLAAAPSASTWVELGDLRRDAGDPAGARDAYAAAAGLPGLSPAERRALAAGQAQLAREDRPAVLVPVVGQDAGWAVGSDFAADNQGVHYATTRLRRGVALAGGFTAGVAFDLRSLGGSAPGGSAVPGSGSGYVSNGAAVHGALGWETDYGPLLLRAVARLGVVRQQGTDAAMRDVGAAALLADGPWQGAVELSDEPAYPTLFTISSLVAPGEAPLTERDVTGTLAGPAGAADVGVSWQRSALSDDNLRGTGQAYARLPLAGPLAAVYQATLITFARRSDRYWDPLHYVAHAAGAELAWRHPRGLTAAVRVLPEYARSRELVAPPPVADTASDGTVAWIPQERSEIVTRAAFQLGASADVGWRAEGWEIAAALAHGRGRAGSYQRTAGTITVRLLP